MSQYKTFREFEPGDFQIRIPESLVDVFVGLKRAGGRPLLVGGAVIDLFCGGEPKDWDVEVFGLSMDQLESTLSEFGNVDLIGKKFGIIKLGYKGLDLEFSVPRRDSRTGVGHKGFRVDFDPNLSVSEAAVRRDFTVNAIAYDYFLDKIEDFHGGVSDLRKGVLRHVDPRTFAEDPMRVFRGIQIIARKLRTASPEYTAMVQGMIERGDLCDVSGDAIFQEMNKMFSKAASFANAAKHMEELGLLAFFGLDKLVGCPQDPKYHPEGDVWEHTKLVLENAFKYRDELPANWRLPFMWGMLLHDIGKPYTTDFEKLHAHGHAEKGASLVDVHMRWWTNSKIFIERVKAIVGLHMRSRELLQGNAKRSAWVRLQHGCRLDVLAYVSMCDSDGRAGQKNGKNGEFAEILKKWKDLGSLEHKVVPVLMGRHLIDRGLRPGRDFSRHLDCAYSYQIENNETDVDVLFEVAMQRKRQKGVDKPESVG